DGFDFPSFQHEPGFKPFFNEIIVLGFAVLNDAHELVFFQAVKLEHSILSQPISMHTVQRSVLVPYSDKQMFDLVADVARYPEFMPWCGGAKVHREDEKGMEASVTISIAGLKQTFTTRNDHDYPKLITIHLIYVPFSELTGTWEFYALAEDACKVVYTMRYACSSRALDAVVGRIFNRIATSFIDSFTQRAQAVYGE